MLKPEVHSASDGGEVIISCPPLISPSGSPLDETQRSPLWSKRQLQHMWGSFGKRGAANKNCWIKHRLHWKSPAVVCNDENIPNLVWIYNYAEGKFESLYWNFFDSHSASQEKSRCESYAEIVCLLSVWDLFFLSSPFLSLSSFSFYLFFHF